MLKTSCRVLIGCLTLLTPVCALAAPTVDELKCEVATDKALDKFTESKVKCLLKCEQGARKGTNPFTDCQPPFAGKTLACIADPVKGVEAKATAAIVKGCAKDCPECYEDCSSTGYPATRVSNTEAKIDLLIPQVACEHSTVKATAKCIDTTAKTLVKFVKAKDACYEKCLVTAFKKHLDPTPCMPTATQPDVVACIQKAEAKATLTLTKACYGEPAAAPSCYDGTTLRPNSAAGWVALAEASVDAGVPNIFCESPSGAFLEQ